MKWIAYTYHGQLPLAQYNSDDYEFSDLPDAIAYIDIYDDTDWRVRRLQGMDNYWICANGQYGMYNDRENYNIYDGKQAVAFRIDGLFERELEIPLPETAVSKAGVMMTDEHAREIGLI